MAFGCHTLQWEAIVFSLNTLLKAVWKLFFETCQPKKQSNHLPPSRDEDLVPLRAAGQYAADFERNSHEDFANVLSYGSVWKECSHLVR